MSKRDYYEVLGVSKTANDDEIKKAYRKLAMKYHPDRVSQLSDAEKKESENKFKELQEAYAVLSESSKRQTYDQFGHSAMGGNSASGGQGGFGGGFNGADFEDIFGAFGEMFGGGRGGRASRQQNTAGEDLEYSVRITLEEAANGCEKNVKYSRNAKCKPCDGKRTQKPSDVITCKTCNGNGQVRFAQGFFSVQQACPDCRGVGKTIKNPCTACRGSGFSNESHDVKISIPAGIESGNTLRVQGGGNAGMDGGAYGDLYVHVEVQGHKVFERQGADLHIRMPITFVDAALGGSIEVITLNGEKVDLKIPEGTQSGQTLRLKDRGVKSLRSHAKGDLYCHIFVETPVKLNEEQKRLIKEFGSSTTVSNHPNRSNLFDKFKNMFNF